jgi:hypothetical protein
MNYVVGHNMPGYLPESDPWISSDWEEARNALLEDMDRHADSLAELFDDYETVQEHEELSELVRAMADLQTAAAGTEWGWTVGNTAYWLSLTEEEPIDE